MAGLAVREGHILEMNAGDAAGQPVQPLDGIPAARLHPVGIQSEAQLFGREIAEKTLQINLPPLAGAGEFHVVIVIHQPAAQGRQPPPHRPVGFRKRLVTGQPLVKPARQAADADMSAAERLMLRRHRVGLGRQYGRDRCG